MTNKLDEEMLWKHLYLAGSHARHVGVIDYRNYFCSKKWLRACPMNRSYALGGQRWSSPGYVPEGRTPAGAKAAKREVRVCARGRSSSHATIRSRLIAAAIAMCCKCVFAKPQ